jgi:hypothetical protein
VTSLGVLTAAGAVALVLGADVWLTGAVVVSALLMILLVGSFRLWDELDGATEGGGGLHMRASLTTRFQGNVGEPSEVQFDMGMADPLQTVEIQSTSARGKPVPFGFVSLVSALFAGKTFPSGFGGVLRGDAGNCWSRVSRTPRYFSNVSGRSQIGSKWRSTMRTLDPVQASATMRR